MNSIYGLAMASIKLGGFELDNKLRELTSIMLVGQIDPIEYDELARLAQEYANPETTPSETNILGALRTINAEIAKINSRLSALEEAKDEEPVEEVIPEWERWNGLPTSGYKFGDKVIHQGVKYISNYVGLNIWEPGIQGTELLWAVIE